MKVVIDLDLHEAIQDFTNRTPATVYDFKSQDTIDFLLYFVREGLPQDLGAGFALKFGMVKTGDASNTLLAYQTVSSYLTDVNSNVYYLMQVNFNTSQMASAISGQSQLACTIEIRYQDPDGEIIHSLNISALVFPTIIAESGVTPPSVGGGYPDPSTLELLVHKNQPSGYAGLDAAGDLTPSIIPVDTQTVVVNAAGDIASAAILATVAANFTTPAANATVSVTVDSTTNLKANSYVRIPVAGYYIVSSITDATHAVLTNNGDPFNAASGTTISTGAVLLPAQAAAGGGSAGQNAYTTTTAAFTVPNTGSTVSVTMSSTAWLAGIGYIVFITGAGYYAVSSITSTTVAVLTNLGYANTNAASGTTIPSGALVSPGGVAGTAGTGSPGANAYDATTAAFTMPAAAASVSVAISNTGWLTAGQEVYIQNAGYFSVASITSPTLFSATNSNYPGAATPGATIAAGAHVSPSGLMGPQGAGGAGLNAFTTLTTTFTQPAVNVNVGAVVGSTAWMATGQTVYITGGGYYTVQSISDLTHVNLINLGYTGNAAAGVSVTSGVNVAPAGLAGQGGNAFTTTQAAFTMPSAPSGSVSVSVVSTLWMVPGQNVYVQNAGSMQVGSITNATNVILINIGSSGNAASGTVIPTGSQVSPGGAIGVPGVQGPAGSLSNASDAISGAVSPEVSIIQGIASGTLSLKKLKAGSNVTLTDQGGSTGDVLIAASGGGASGPFDPRTGFYEYEDFLWLSASAPPAPWAWYPSGTGSYTASEGNALGNYPWAFNNTNKAQGVTILSSGGGTSNAFNGGTLVKGYLGATMNALVLGLGAFDMVGRIALYNASLPPTGQGFRITFGLWTMAAGGTDIYAGANPYASLFLDYSPDNNSGNLRVGYCNGAWSGGLGTATAPTYGNCSASITAATFMWWEIKVATNGDVTAYLNGTLIGTFTGVAPLGVPLTPIIGIQRNTAAATNWIVEVDSLFIYQAYTR